MCQWKQLHFCSLFKVKRLEYFPREEPRVHALIIPFLCTLADPCFVHFLVVFSSHEHVHNSRSAILTGRVEKYSLNGTFRNGSFVCESLFCLYQSHWFKYIWICLFLCEPVSVQHLTMLSLLGDVTERHCLLTNASFSSVGRVDYSENKMCKTCLL